jgi:hypothetical protein
MASILIPGSFLAGSLISLLIPVCLLIALIVWQTRAILRLPANPGESAAQGAGAAEVEGSAGAGAGEGAAPPPRA